MTNFGMSQSRSVCQSILKYGQTQEKLAGTMSFIRPYLALSKEFFKPRGRQMMFQYKSPFYEKFNQQLVTIMAH